MIDVTGSLDNRIITINRPDKANALTKDMLIQLVTAFDNARDAASVILTGTGTVFSAGADLRAAKAGLATDAVWQELADAIHACRGFTVAALNGTAAGGAAGLILACDVRVAVASANYFYPVVKLGYMPQPPHVIDMVKLIGEARTKLVLVAGERLTAATAQTLGLFDLVYEDDILSSAQELCANVVKADSAHVFALKSAIRS